MNQEYKRCDKAVQEKIDWLDAVMASGLPNSAKITAFAIYKRINTNQNDPRVGTCWETQAGLGELVAQSRQTVCMNLPKLEEAGFIKDCGDDHVHGHKRWSMSHGYAEKKSKGTNNLAAWNQGRKDKVEALVRKSRVRNSDKGLSETVTPPVRHSDTGVSETQSPRKNKERREERSKERTGTFADAQVLPTSFQAKEAKEGWQIEDTPPPGAQQETEHLPSWVTYAGEDLVIGDW